MFSDGFYIGIIYVISIALFMTLFETLFFVLYLVPQKSGTIKNRVYKLKEMFYPFSAPEALIDYLSVAEQRENILNKLSNDKSIVIISFEMAFFILIMYVCYRYIIEKELIFNILFLSVLTSIILIIFQLVMYIYAGGLETPDTYKYMTDTELKYLVLKELEKETKPINQTT